MEDMEIWKADYLHSVPGPNMMSLPKVLRAVVSLASCLTWKWRWGQESRAEA